MKAVVLAGGVGFGNCPLTIVRPRPLFPVPDGVLLEYALRALRTVGVEDVMICAGSSTPMLAAHCERFPPAGMRLHWHQDAFLRGTAGCLGDVASFLQGERFLVLDGNLVLDGDLSCIVDDHKRQGAAMTLGVVPARTWYGGQTGESDGDQLAPLGVYVVESDVLGHVPEQGYFDLKEQLIPRLRERHFATGVSLFRGRHRRVVDARSYARLVQEILHMTFGEEPFARLTAMAPGVWAGPDVTVAPSALLIGPLVLGSGTTIGEHAIVVGPGFLGERVAIESKSVVVGSILWPEATVGREARVEDSIVTDHFQVARFSSLAHCVAIDAGLALAQMNGLHRAGYAVRAMTDICAAA
ncbi:MAG TPA: NDP-sugar synthase [Planctomycetota bacterium]|nr:NDP-sugar synthase [Planctomycetota bacterium]